MILNMVGANEVQIVDFTLSDNVDIGTSDGLDINDVYLPDGTYSGFAIWPISSLTVENSTVEHIYSQRNISNVSQSGLNIIYYSTVSEYEIWKSSNVYYAQYDATNHKLKIRCGISSIYLKAGDYRLVIW